MRLTAAVLAAVAVLLLVPGGGSSRRRSRQLAELPGGGPDHGPGGARGRRPPWLSAGPPVLLVGVAGGAVLLLTVDGLRLVLASIGLCVGGAVVVLLRRGRRARLAERRQALVVEVCEALVGELRAGQPLVASLVHATEVWPELDPVLATSRLGADVPDALRAVAGLPGAEDVAEIAAAWQVSQTSGAGLAGALAQVATTAREREATRHLVRGELASAQATARLVALLPVAALAMSAGIGGHPWHFLLDTPVGLGCLGLGAGFAFCGLWWIDRIAVGVLRR